MIGVPKRAALVFVAMLSLGGLLAAVPASAQELSPEQLKLAREYIDLTDKGGVYEQTLVETAIRTMQAIVSQNPGLEQQTSDTITKTLDYYRTRKGDLMDQFARVYAQNFSAEELQAIVDFYSSPAGKKLAQANQTLNGSLQMVMKVFQTNLNTEFFAKVRAEMKAAGYDV